MKRFTQGRLAAPQHPRRGGGGTRAPPRTVRQREAELSNKVAAATATNPEYVKLFGALGTGSLAAAIALVVLIPFLRKLISDKAEVPAEELEMATVVPVV